LVVVHSKFEHKSEWHDDDDDDPALSSNINLFYVVPVNTLLVIETV